MTADAATAALRSMLSRYRNPVVTLDEALRILATRYRMNEAVELMVTGS
ncbi:hypothetical protein [Nocardia sp. NPDC050413]